MRLRPFSLDLTSPLETARGPIAAREGFLVSVASGDGGTDAPDSSPGLGEATPLPNWTESRSACESALQESAAVASSASASRACGVGAHDALSRLDPDETPAARHGVALALADAAARDADRSLASHLADDRGLRSPGESVPVNATVGDADAEETVRAAESAVDDGFRCLKVKVGARSLDADAERLRAVRRAVGDEIALRADANGSWDRRTAERALDRLEPLNLAYVEQPLPPGDLDGTARLRDGSDVPIALDESLAGRDLDRVLDAGAADVVVLKPMALGGPDRALSAALRAREAGVEPVVTTTIDAVVARSAAVHVAAAIPNVGPCGLATGSLLESDLAADPCPIASGETLVPSGPGLAGDAFDALR
ncbi:mandelate racemase/muconate lactonizing enzyme family protein [Halorubrum trueperi]|uniref:o-succinylbenzoate synthase n=1 Tax=Halorubrum trueperi TaxID=2004704 RepID=A0ABD5UMV9_9EURY